MRVAYFCALLIAGLLMLLVMTVLGVELLPERVVNGSAFFFNLAWGDKEYYLYSKYSSFHIGVDMGSMMRTKFANFPI